MLSIFPCVCKPSVYLLWKTSIQFFSPFFNQVVCFLILSCMSCLYILDINPLLVISFANIFYHCLGCLFVSWMVSFTMQNLLSLTRSLSLLFSFFFCLRRQIQNIIAIIYVKVLHMFSSSSFMVSCLTFMSLIHMFIAALFTIAKIWKQHECLSKDE